MFLFRRNSAESTSTRSTREAFLQNLYNIFMALSKCAYSAYYCTMGRNRTLRSENMNGSTGNSRAGRALDRRDPAIPVSSEAQREVGSPARRAAQVVGNGKWNPMSRTTR